MVFDKNNFRQEVEDYTGVVLVDFFASWCGPCQMMTPIIEGMISENKDQSVKIGKLDIDENQGIAEKYEVMSVPTFLLFKNGKVVVRKAGYCGKEDLKQLVLRNK